MLLPWHIFSWPEGDFRTIYPRGELPLLERPFVLGHYDCWGLVMSYFRQQHNVELTDYRVDYPWWEDGYPDNFYHDCWYECGFREFDGPPQPGDMIIMQVQANKWNHAGILMRKYAAASPVWSFKPASAVWGILAGKNGESVALSY
jgi:cell wall-associated NlpC family hydrolase